MTNQYDEDDKLVLTGAGLLEFLNQIDELKDKNLEIIEMADGLHVTIGDSTYVLQCETNNTIEVTDDLVDTINDIDIESYDEFAEDLDDEPVEGGLIKELIKTLAIGGLVRLTKSALTS